MKRLDNTNQHQIKNTEIWPNFFIVGAPRCGTTSIYEILRNVKGIYMSTIKEPNYFCVKVISDDHSQRPIRNKKKYLELFWKVKNEVAVGESSPDYLRDPESANLIHQVSPNARIIAILRDPIERVYSHWLMSNRLNEVKLSFHDELKKSLKNQLLDIQKLDWRFGASLYSEDLKRYLDVFETNQVKTLIFEEFVRDVKGTINDILKFLKVNSKIPDSLPLQNQYGVPRDKISEFILHNLTIKKIATRIIPKSARTNFGRNFLTKNATKPKILGEDVILLRELYSNDVEKLQSILGRTLSWPNFN